MDCPVCQTLFVYPRVYNCGHSVCELCMLKIDINVAKMTPPCTLPLFRCPICRSENFLPFNERPLNHSLIGLIEQEKGSEYDEIKTHVKCEADKWARVNEKDLHACALVYPQRDGHSNVPDVQNVSSIAQHVRKRKAICLFQSIIPSIMRAVYNGYEKLHITTHVTDLISVSRELANMLFEYGIHSISFTESIFTIRILDDEGESNTACYRNPNYTHPQFEQLSAAVVGDEVTV